MVYNGPVAPTHPGLLFEQSRQGNLRCCLGEAAGREMGRRSAFPGPPLVDFSATYQGRRQTWGWTASGAQAQGVEGSNRPASGAIPPPAAQNGRSGKGHAAQRPSDGVGGSHSLWGPLRAAGG